MDSKIGGGKDKYSDFTDLSKDKLSRILEGKKEEDLRLKTEKKMMKTINKCLNDNYCTPEKRMKRGLTILMKKDLKLCEDSKCIEIWIKTNDDEEVTFYVKANGNMFGLFPLDFFKSAVTIKEISIYFGENFDSNVSMDSMFERCTSLKIAKIFRIKSNYKKDFPTKRKTYLPSMAGIFKSCANLEKVSFDFAETIKPEEINKETSGILSAGEMFFGCKKLQKVDGLKYIINGTVRSMEAMFYECEELKQIDLKGSDMSNVGHMKMMFCGCKNLSEVEGFENLTFNDGANMEYMFGDCENLKKVSFKGAIFYGYANMERMFCGCKNLEEVNFHKIKFMKKKPGSKEEYTSLFMNSMFSGCKNLRNVVGGHCVLKKNNRYWANSLAHFCAQEVGLLDKDGNEVKFKTTKKLSKKKEEFGSMLNRDYLCTIKGKEGLEFEEME